MNNTHLWRALGRNFTISILLFGSLLGLLWLVETYLLPCGEAGRGLLLRWHDPAWVVGIPASIIGVAYILTVRDPHNYTGFFAGVFMSVLLGIQFLLQNQYDSAFLYFFVFIPFQEISGHSSLDLIRRYAHFHHRRRSYNYELCQSWFLNSLP